MTRDVLQFPGNAALEDDLLEGLEALLFAAGAPTSTQELAEALGVDRGRVREGLEVLSQRRAGAGVVLEQVASGWQFRTSPRFADVVRKMLGDRPRKLTRPALEVLSIIAYRQPVTRAEVDEIRGVGSGRILKALVERGLTRVAGRRREPGRPLEYRTTPAFLALFGLKDLGDLPTLLDREDLVGVEEDPAAG